MAALLNSLQMGFQTVAIQQRRRARSRRCSPPVKTEFGTYQTMLRQAQKQLGTVSRTVDTLVGTRSRAMERQAAEHHRARRPHRGGAHLRGCGTTNPQTAHPPARRTDLPRETNAAKRARANHRGLRAPQPPLRDRLSAFLDHCPAPSGSSSRGPCSRRRRPTRRVNKVTPELFRRWPHARGARPRRHPQRWARSSIPSVSTRPRRAMPSSAPRCSSPITVARCRQT